MKLKVYFPWKFINQCQKHDLYEDTWVIYHAKCMSSDPEEPIGPRDGKAQALKDKQNQLEPVPGKEEEPMQTISSKPGGTKEHKLEKTEAAPIRVSMKAEATDGNRDDDREDKADKDTKMGGDYNRNKDTSGAKGGPSISWMASSLCLMLLVHIMEI